MIDKPCEIRGGGQPCCWHMTNTIYRHESIIDEQVCCFCGNPKRVITNSPAKHVQEHGPYRPNKST